MNCQRCQIDNPAGANFCVRCGGALGPDHRVRGGARPAPPPQQYAAPRPFDPPPQHGAYPRYPGAPAVAYPPRPVAAKSPGLAAVLSLLIVGLGQFYNEDAKKGVVMLVAGIVAGVVSFGLGWLAVAVWSAVDAYQVAEGRGRRWS